MLQGRDLILATKPFAKEIRWKSWYHTISTLLVLALALAGSYLLPYVWLRVLCGVFSGLVMVRMFVIYHDQQHHAILYKSVAGNFIFSVYGLYILAPTSIWKRSHDYHHNNNSKLFSASIGSYPIMTVHKFSQCSAAERRYYLFVRHPLTILFGYIFTFIYGMCIRSFTSSMSKHWDSLLALALHVAGSTLVIVYGGWLTWTLSVFIPFFIADMMGSYLFYAQHNFPGVSFRDNIEWSYHHAALESSSYMLMNPFWKWVTANIGYHHIHHMNSRIPFYRLPEAMEKIPEMQQAKTTSLRLRDVYACLRLKVWDAEANSMIGLSEIPRR